MEGEIEINVGGKPRKLRFSMWAIEENQRLVAEVKPSQFAATTANTTAIIYAGLANQRRIENEQLEKAGKANEKKKDYPYEEVKHWVYDLYDSENGYEEIQKVIKCFTECNAFKNLQKSVDEDKKKLNGTQSEALPLVNSA